MLINGDANTSSSLEIVEPENRITFSSSIHSTSFDISRDDLNFSKDQQSISFHIEDDKREVKETIFAHSILSNDPPKRNRKQIFSKYKINSPNQQPAQQPSNTNADNEIMRAFDQIFSLGVPKISGNAELLPTKNFQPKTYIEPEIPKNLQSSRQVRSINKLAEVQPITPQRNGYSSIKVIQKVEEGTDIGQSGQFFRTPLDKSGQKPKQVTNKANISNISDIEYRISVIDNKDIDFSRDSSDFAEILNAEIFQDRSSVKSPRNTAELIPTTDTRESTPKIAPSFQKQPNPIPIQSLPVPLSNNNGSSPIQKQSEQNMQQSRFSDVYQRIDMSQSIANSILVRNPRLQIFNNPSTISNGNFMGSTGSIGSMKTFSKSGSFGNLINQEDETLINGLSSQKMMEEASEEKRVPAYLRKAAKSNSIYPNFNNPALKLNVDSQNGKLQQLVQNFSDALGFLQKMLDKIRLKQQKRKEITALFSNGITLHKFKTCDWESCMNFQHLQLLKPKQNLMAKQWNDSKVQKALANYRKIVQHHRGIKLNLNDERGIAKYFQIRKKYWDIQKNLMFITDDMYTRIMCLVFPKHFIQIKKILEEGHILISYSQIQVKKTQLEHFRLLRNKNDELCASQVGSEVIKKLINQIKFNSSVY